ncbi:MAG: GMC oxidoreductase [Acidobacteriota bacterium]
MARIYDAVVIGTGAGGGMAIKTLCEAGLKVVALNPGRRVDPARDFRGHRQRYDMKFRGFGDPRTRHIRYHDENEYTEGLWEHDVAYTTAPGTQWEWLRVKVTGGKANFWGRSSARFGDIDFKAASLDGFDVDWPVSYQEIAPYYSRVERYMGVASTVQNRPSNPDGEYLPPMKYRCLDHILAGAAEKMAIPYLPDRIAQLTVAHNGHPACHFCASCSSGCEIGAFFSPPWFTLADAQKTGNLELRTNAIASHVTVNRDGRASGVAYVDRDTGRQVNVRARAVVVAASCLETTRILLNSRSRHWPTGIANSSGELGRNLCDHLYGASAYGCLPQLVGRPSFPDNVSNSTIAWMPRWQNLDSPRRERFLRGYAVYPGGGCGEFPYYHGRLEGFGSSFKKEIKRYYPAPVSFTIQAPSLPSPENYVDIDPQVRDRFGIPALRFHFKWGTNELQMWEHSKAVCAELLRTAGGELWGAGEPEMPGYSQHETGTCRMGSDPKKFVTNGWGQCHDASNLFVCDASIFPYQTDKTTTLSILAFTLRTCEYLLDRFRRREI